MPKSKRSKKSPILDIISLLTAVAGILELAAPLFALSLLPTFPMLAGIPNNALVGMGLICIAVAVGVCAILKS